MNKLTIYIFLAFLLTATSCKKYLEQAPDNRTTLDSPDKVAQLLGTAYPQANYMDFAETISDNVGDKGIGEADRTNSAVFLFNDVDDDEQDSPEFYWYSCYSAIAAANQALDAIQKADNQDAYKAHKGEALVARAYAHFMLVTFFSKMYDPTTAESDPGIPYVTEPENVVFKNYERKTVAYVYQMIEKDLLEGLPLISDQLYKIPKYHFTRAAAHAFASRFYLFKGEYEKVVEHANQVFSGSNVVDFLRPWNTTYLTMTYNELFATYARASEPANLLLVETSSIWARNYYTVRYGLDAAKQDEILGQNVTGGRYAFTNHLYTAGTNNYLIPKINEYFVRLTVNANTGLPYVMVPLFTAEEVLFNRAEANIFLNNLNATLADLNTYASTRIVNYNANNHIVNESKLQNYYGSGNVRLDALLALLDFKRAEYVQEGMRWFDLLRYGVPVQHTTIDGQTLTLESDDLRRVFQIPASAKTSGVDQNPR